MLEGLMQNADDDQLAVLVHWELPLRSHDQNVFAAVCERQRGRLRNNVGMESRCARSLQNGEHHRVIDLVGFEAEVANLRVLIPAGERAMEQFAGVAGEEALSHGDVGNVADDHLRRGDELPG